MAIEFGSRRETFENYKVYETMLDDACGGGRQH